MVSQIVDQWLPGVGFTGVLVFLIVGFSKGQIWVKFQVDALERVSDKRVQDAQSNADAWREIAKLREQTVMKLVDAIEPVQESNEAMLTILRELQIAQRMIEEQSTRPNPHQRGGRRHG